MFGLRKLQLENECELLASTSLEPDCGTGGGAAGGGRGSTARTINVLVKDINYRLHSTLIERHRQPAGPAKVDLTNSF